MEPPRGYKIDCDEPCVLKLLMSLYGLRQAGSNWFLYLKDSLLRRGFKQSELDPCLFYSEHVIILIYVDDAILFSKHTIYIEEILSSLTSEFHLTDEGDFNTYLGVSVNKIDTYMLKLSQPNLIEKIIKTLGLENAKTAPTPASIILTKDENGEEREHKWNYRSVVGMLGYLQQTTRPDISFAVHQCARFSTNPKRSHEVAVKRIGRYLLGTKDEGIIFNPSNTSYQDCYVDADFAGMYKVEDSDDPISVKSRTGYVLMFAGSPLLWSTKLQSEIALSTTEAEYIALSQSMRDLIPSRELLDEVSQILQYSAPDQSKTISTVFEDNNGALELAKCPRMRPRTKHIAIKYHHFREHVTSGNIKVESIDTSVQIADIFTKPLTRTKFETLRKLLLGW